MHRALLPLAVLLAVPAPGAARGQDPAPDALAPERHRIVHRVAQGQVTTIEHLTTKVLRYRFRRVEGGEGPEREVPAEVEHLERRQYTDTIRAAADGAPTRIERHVHAHTTASEIRPSNQRTAEQKALHGRTLWLTREGAGPAARWRATTAAGEPVPGGAADPPPVPALAGFLPSDPVAVGEAWTLDATAVRAVLGDGWRDLEVREGRASLHAVVTDGPRRLARLEVRLSWVAAHEEVLVLEAALAGPVVVDLQAARLVRADLHGTLRVTTRPEARTRGVADTEVEGTLAMRWRFVDGAPVAAPAEEKRQ